MSVQTIVLLVCIILCLEATKGEHEETGLRRIRRKNLPIRIDDGLNGIIRHEIAYFNDVIYDVDFGRLLLESSMSMSMGTVDQNPNPSTIVPSTAPTLSPTNTVIDTNVTNMNATNTPVETLSPTSVIESRLDSNSTITSEPTQSPSSTNSFDPRTPPTPDKEESSWCHENGDTTNSEQDDEITIEAIIVLNNNTNVSVESVTQVFNDVVDNVVDCTPTRRNLASSSEGTCQQQSCPDSLCATYFLCTREESMAFAGCAQVEIELIESLPSGNNVTVSCAKSSNQTVSTGAIAGWIIGGLAVVGLLCACVSCRYKNNIEYDSGLLYAKVEDDDEDPQMNAVSLLSGDVEDVSAAPLVSVNKAAQFDAAAVEDDVPFVGDVVEQPQSDWSLM